MKIIDSHSHYDDAAFDDDRYAVIDKMLSENIMGFVAVGSSLESSEASVQLAQRYGCSYAAIGVHPEYASTVSSDYIKTLRSLSRMDKVTAIGEIGLDYHYDGYDKEKQAMLFIEQIKLAEELNLPIIVHSRDATQDTLEILDKYRPKGVVHCFSGSPETAKILLNWGFYIGFTGVVTFKNAKKAVEICEIVPMDRMLIETDCPYMAPVPFRGKRNFSGYLDAVVDKIANIKGLDRDVIINNCNKNTIQLFNMKGLD